MARIERIGILTSGGDCAGLNAVIRAVVHRAVEGYGWEVVGIHQGTAGLMAPWLAGVLFDRSGNYALALVLAGSLGMVSCLTSWFFGHRRARLHVDFCI